MCKLNICLALAIAFCADKLTRSSKKFLMLYAEMCNFRGLVGTEFKLAAL